VGEAHISQDGCPYYYTGLLGAKIMRFLPTDSAEEAIFFELLVPRSLADRRDGEKILAPLVEAGLKPDKYGNWEPRTALSSRSYISI